MSAKNGKSIEIYKLWILLIRQTYVGHTGTMSTRHDMIRGFEWYEFDFIFEYHSIGSSRNYLPENQMDH